MAEGWVWFWFWFGVFLPVAFAFVPCCVSLGGGLPSSLPSFLPCLFLFSNHLLKVLFLWYKKNILRDTKKRRGKHFVFFSLFVASRAQQTPTCHSKWQVPKFVRCRFGASEWRNTQWLPAGPLSKCFPPNFLVSLIPAMFALFCFSLAAVCFEESVLQLLCKAVCFFFVSLHPPHNRKKVKVCSWQQQHVGTKITSLTAQCER